MNFFKYIFSKWFVVNVLLALIIVAVGIFAVRSWLEETTLHGETIVVPDIKTYSLDEVEDVLGGLSLNYKVIDSSQYTPKFPKHSVIKQDPREGSEVKKGRVIYLTVNAGGYPSMRVPYLIGKSNRQAVSYLEAIGFKVGKFEYKEDIAKNVVLDLKYNGEIIDTLTRLPKQSVIDLVLGTGLDGDKTKLPNFIGDDLDKAKSKLIEFSLNLRNVEYDGDKQDDVDYFVYRQEPKFVKDTTLVIGSNVDLWLTSDTLKLPKKQIEEELEDE